jgi:serine protease Do
MSKDVMQIRRWVATVAIVAALAAGGILASGLKDWTGHPVFGAGRAPIPAAREAVPVNLGNFADGFSTVVKPALPAVVNIHSSKVVKASAQGSSPFFNDPFFRQFFGDQSGSMQPRSEREQSLGSGVIVSADGTILTNNHVIDGASDIKVQLNDRREFQAKLVGTDPKTDIAVLKIDAKDLPTVPLGDSSKLQVGDIVFAIGDPFGIGETATMGIVSATGRGNLGIENYEDFIQTDAAINPGNSGGAMIDLHGNLVGINTAILSHGSGGNQGIGFAIPIGMARNVMNQVLDHGKVVRGYLGVYIQDVNPVIAKAFNLNQNGGVLLGDVTPGGPGSKAGLKKGDIVLALNGEPVNERNDLQLRISQLAPGTSVKLNVWRGSEAHDVTVTLGELPEKAELGGNAPGESSSGALEGVDVQNLTPEIAQQLNLPVGTHGVIVSSVDPSSRAAVAGLDRGQVIQEINHRPISNVEEYRQALAAAGDKPVLLLVNRGGVTNYMVVEPH